MRLLGLSLSLTLAICVAAPVILGVMALERAPLVNSNIPITSADYKRAETLLKRAQFALADQRHTTTISATQSDLDSLATFLTHSLNGLAGTVSLTQGRVRMLATYRLPSNPVGDYLNVAMTVRESTTGLDVETLDIGHIHMNAWAAQPFIHVVSALVLGHKLGGDVIGSVKGLAVAERSATLTIRPDATIENRFKERVTNVAIRATTPAVAVYYRQIMKIASGYDGTQQVPLVTFLQPLLAMAEKRSENGDPVAEMHGVIFALAIYFGGDGLDRLRNALLPPDLARVYVLNNNYVVVRGRHDHVQHFLVSAAFTISGGIGFTTTIGEAKEFHDLLQGGEDFSFQDIAADRTGITFARIANTPAGARYLESLGRRPLSEDLFFPVVKDLKEGMSPRQFDKAYHDTSSPAFKARLAQIDDRIHALPAYKMAR